MCFLEDLGKEVDIIISVNIEIYTKLNEVKRVRSSIQLKTKRSFFSN